MKVILFGASGMVGKGVLRECVADPAVERVLLVSRSAVAAAHPKVEEIVHADFHDHSAIAPRYAGYDACFFCLGVTSVGMSEADYTRVTYDLTLAAARALAQANPRMRFVYVSGAGTDSTEKGRTMWARVKGRTENALLALPFEAYMFRPGFIEPMDGIRSKTPLYQTFITLGRPLLPLARRAFPRAITTTRAVGRAMIEVAENGAPTRVLEAADINARAAARTGDRA